MSDATSSVHQYPLHPVYINSPFVNRSQADLIALLKRHKANVSKNGVLEWARYRMVALPVHGETFDTALASDLLVGENDAEKEEDYDHIMESVGNWDLGSRAGLEVGRAEFKRYLAVALPVHGETFETALASGLLVGENNAEKEEDYDHIMASVGNWDLGSQAGRAEFERYLAVALPVHGETFDTALASDLLVGENDAEKEEDYDKIMESVGNWSLRTGRGGM
jgi:hypothetical protein